MKRRKIERKGRGRILPIFQFTIDAANNTHLRFRVRIWSDVRVMNLYRLTAFSTDFHVIWDSSFHLPKFFWKIQSCGPVCTRRSSDSKRLGLMNYHQGWVDIFGIPQMNLIRYSIHRESSQRYPRNASLPGCKDATRRNWHREKFQCS